MAHGRKQARVELLLHVRLALDRVAQIHAHRQIQGRREQPRKTAELCDAHSAGAVGRRDRHRRAAQHIKRHVTEELIGLLVIAAQDALRNAVRVALIVSRFVSGICLALIVPLTAPMSLVMHLRITSPSKNVESVSAIVEAVLRFA